MPTDLPRPECNIVELRQYTLHPGQRDALIELFEREFVESQEAVGMTVMGQFRDLDDADRFTWLRGFHDLAARPAALNAFYTDPVWQAHRTAANATMVDSDNVLLLRPAWPGSGISMHGRTRAAPGSSAATALPAGLLEASIFHLREPAGAELLERCRPPLAPAHARAGAAMLGWYVTESRPNNFPRLPVREGEPVLVAFRMFDDETTFDAFTRSGAWAREVQPLSGGWLARPAQSLRLSPTARSALHAGASARSSPTPQP